MDKLNQEWAQIDAFANLQANLNQKQLALDKTVALLRAIKSGAVSVDVVNIGPNGWSVNPPTPPVEEIAIEKEPSAV